MLTGLRYYFIDIHELPVEVRSYIFLLPSCSSNQLVTSPPIKNKLKNMNFERTSIKVNQKESFQFSWYLWIYVIVDLWIYVIVDFCGCGFMSIITRTCPLVTVPATLYQQWLRHLLLLPSYATAFRSYSWSNKYI